MLINVCRYFYHSKKLRLLTQLHDSGETVHEPDEFIQPVDRNTTAPPPEVVLHI